MLIIFGGLPGTGKTTIARHLARKLGAAYIRIDCIEQVLIQSNTDPAYKYAMAADNLCLGMITVADAVNPINLTRNMWKKVAVAAKSQFLEVELICSAPTEHRTRVEERLADIPGHRQPIWQNVLARHYESWDSPHLIINTALILPHDAVKTIIKTIRDNQNKPIDH